MVRLKLPCVRKKASDPSPSILPFVTPPSSSTPSTKSKPSKQKSPKAASPPSRRSQRLTSGVVGSSKRKETNEEVILVRNDEEDSEATITAPIAKKPSSQSSSKAMKKVKKEKVSSKKRKHSRDVRGGEEISTPSKKDEDTLETKWERKSIAAGRIYNLESLKEHGWNMMMFLNRQRWTNFLQIEEPLYRRLVKTFYANAVISNDRTKISSQIKGIDIVLTSETLAEILNLPNLGNRLCEDKWFHILKTTKKEVETLMAVNPKRELISSNLHGTERIMHNMCVHSFAPRVGSFEKVTDLDLLIIYHLIKKIPLNLPFIILHYMMNAIETLRQSASLPYGMALTRVFKHFKLPLEEEDATRERTTFFSKNLKQMKLKIMKPFEEDPDQESSEQDPEEPKKKKRKESGNEDKKKKRKETESKDQKKKKKKKKEHLVSEDQSQKNITQEVSDKTQGEHNFGGQGDQAQGEQNADEQGKLAQREQERISRENHEKHAQGEHEYIPENVEQMIDNSSPRVEASEKLDAEVEASIALAQLMIPPPNVTNPSHTSSSLPMQFTPLLMLPSPSEPNIEKPPLNSQIHEPNPMVENLFSSPIRGHTFDSENLDKFCFSPTPLYDKSAPQENIFTEPSLHLPPDLSTQMGSLGSFFNKGAEPSSSKHIPTKDHYQEAAAVPESEPTPPSLDLAKLDKQVKKNSKEIKKALLGIDLLQKAQRKEAARSYQFQCWFVNNVLPSLNPNIAPPIFDPPHLEQDVPQPAASDSSGGSSPSQ